MAVREARDPGAAPRTEIVPDVIGVRPRIMRISVVLPAPLWPRRATRSPASIFRLTLRTVSSLPYCLLTFSINKVVIGFLSRQEFRGAPAALAVRGL